ncbi:peptidase C65 otubain protein [Ceratobasidium sp. AG-Ba]|nr:peptidase C65 otubain protein [Ceratobasidium sp. AG-Ba]
MSSPTDSDWSLISHHEHQKDSARRKQEILLQDAAATSVANQSNGRRLGTSRTQYQMEEPGTSSVGFPSTQPLAPSPPLSAPIPLPEAMNGSSRRGSKKPPPSAFPRTEDPDGNEREPSKPPSFTRKLRTSLLGGKNPFLSGNKNGSKDKQEQVVVVPITRSPEPDAVLVPHPVDAELNVPQPPLSAPPGPLKSSRIQPQPPVTAHAQSFYSSQPYPVIPTPSTTPGQSSGELSTPELVQSIPLDPHASKSRSVPIVELPPRTRAADRQADPALGALQTHRSAPGKAVYASTSSGSGQTEVRPLPQVPTLPPRHPPTTASTSRSYQAAKAALGVMANPLPNPLPTPPASTPAHAPMPAPAQAPTLASVPVSAPVPVATQPPPTTSSRSYHRDSSASHANTSSPPVVRYPTSGDRTSRASRTSYATTATTPSLSSSRTHGSTSASETQVPPKGAERVNWDTAPPTRLALGGSSRRAASTDQLQVTADDAWNDSIAQLSLRSGQPQPQPQLQPQSQPQDHQAGYHIEMSSTYRNAMAPPPTNEATRPRTNKLQRQATAPASAPPTTVTYVYYDPEPPLISHTSRLSDLKDDYRNPGSERSAIIRRKINYLRFELGYTGLRRSRGDGNCFYRSFAFAWLTQIYHADDRAVAVISALENLEMAQNYVEVGIPGHPSSTRVYAFLQDMIRGMELRKTDQKSLLKVFQNRQQSDDIVGYVRLITSAYIRLMPEMHGSIFHPDDPSLVISPLDFCEIYVEQLGQDAGKYHIQISALSRALNTCVYIYRLDDTIDGKAPNEQDVPAHCTRFIPPDLPPVTEPVSLLFRPGHYDILERDRAAH